MARIAAPVLPLTLASLCACAALEAPHESKSSYEAPPADDRLETESVDEVAVAETTRAPAPSSRSEPRKRRAVGAVAAPARPTEKPTAGGGEGAARDLDGAPPPAREAPAVASRAAEAPPVAAAPPSSPGVRAGAADDNLQFNAFLGFLRDNRGLAFEHAVADRVVLEVTDENGRPISNAQVSVDGADRRRTYADGRALLHPQRWGVSPNAEVRIRTPLGEKRVPLAEARARKLSVQFDAARPEHQRVPLDIAFVIDTTGSMGDEIRRLKQTLDVIVFQVRHADPRPELRLGMVLFKDRGDSYVTEVVPFTSDVAAFERSLAKVSAGGGGDGPEDVQAALHDVIRKMDWREDGLRLGFLVGDAAPHLDYGQSYTYLDAAEEAAKKGIKLTTIGASGLDKRAELVWRQVAQATMSPFVFLTYGETGDSEGSASSVSHHVGSNWVAEDLDAIIIRMVKTELAHLAPRGLRPRRDWFSAAPSSSQPADAVLEELFARSARQLVDYAVEPLAHATPTLVLPIAGMPEALTESLRRRVALGLSRRPEFRLVESDDRAKLMAALAEQLRLSVDTAKGPEVGKMVPAELAVLGKLASTETGKREVMLELVRIETGEVLSLSLLEIDQRLVD